MGFGDTMTALMNRVTKLEAAHGKDDMDRWLNSLTDGELEARISELDQSLRASLAAEGIDCASMTSDEVCAVVAEFEANGGHRPARFERESS